MNFSCIEIINYFILLTIIFLFTVNLINIITIKKISRYSRSLNSSNRCENQEYISVLIPARNEERIIGRCVESALNQNYNNFEVIVLDDNSTDNTSKILSEIRNNRLKIIKGKQIEDGWVGKNFACKQLSEAAKGNYILFIDADTILEKNALENSVKFIKSQNADLVSFFPRQITISFWEKIIIPLLHFVVLTMLPLILVEKTKRTSLTMANGQFMLFRRTAYDKIGGHYSVKNRIVEDVWLGRKIKISGGKLIFADGTDIAYCRMYKNLNEIIEGFSKNIFPGLSFSTAGIIFVITFFFFLYIIPYIMLIYGIIINTGTLILTSIISIILAITIRITHSLKFKLPLHSAFFHIISSISLIILSINSYRIIKFGSGAVWKERKYPETMIKQKIRE